MEVHHHPKVEKKKFKEYFLEFLMIFLAVTLGFFAENIRENITERHKEKEYIESMIQDLKTDTANLSSVTSRYKNQISEQDTLMQFFDSINRGFNINFMGHIPSIIGFPDFIYADATIEQLKNSGGFRLIRNKNAVDSINAYAADVEQAFIDTRGLSNFLHELDNARNDFINYHAIKEAILKGKTPEQMQNEKMDFLISYNKADEDRFYDKILNYQIRMQSNLDGDFIPLKQVATRLIAYLKKEYHLK